MATFHLMREETYEVPRYNHWWQGWPSRIRGLIVTEIQWDANDEQGIYETGRTHRFCGWQELLRPTNHLTRLVPTGDTAEAEGRMENAGLVFGPIAFGPVSTQFRCGAVRMTDQNGKELGSFSASAELYEGDTLHVTPQIYM
jgi:hypothetical protein